MKDFGKYPIDSHLESISESLQTQNIVLIKAEPGAGKTTRVPPYLIDKIDGEIIILEPRRLAAKLTAERVSSFFDEACGNQVGYKIRQDFCTSDKTKITFITEGLFVRLLQNDPALKNVKLIILDEFHERNIQTDLALALILKLQKESRPDLKLIIMSATLDTSDLEKFLEKSKTFDIKGSVFPTTIEYYPNKSSGRQRPRYWDDHAADAIERMLNDERCPLNILTFLPGLGEIRKLEQKLKERGLDREALILPLSSALPAKEQGQVFEGNERKIILATNVAETSLTLPDITGVIDLGTAKIAAFAPWSGMPSLELTPISQASSIQRAGRAGRTQEGLVFRLYSEAEYVARPKFTSPDIERVELSHVVLDILSLGYHMEALAWFQAPNERNLDSSFQLLKMLGCIDQEESLSKKGLWISRIPLHPRLGNLIYESKKLGFLEQGILASSLINEGTIIRGKTPEDDDFKSDLYFQMNLFLNLLDEDYKYITDGKKKTKVSGLVKSLRKKLGTKEEVILNEETLNRSLLSSFPDRVGIKRELKNKKDQGALYNFVMGKGGSLSDKSILFSQQPKYFIALESMENPKLKGDRAIQVRSAVAIGLDLLKEDPAGLILDEDETLINEKKGSFQVIRHKKYGNLIIESKILSQSDDQNKMVLDKALKNSWPYPFENDLDLIHYNQKIKLLDTFDIEHNFPLFEGEMLDLLIEDIASGKKSFNEILEKSLLEYIYEQLSLAEVDHLQQLFPNTIKLSNNNQVNILFDSDSGPFISGFIQDFYGVTTIPKIAGENIPLKIHLLAPNKRIAAVISNLNNFWSGSYQSVRKDLAGRYPKHYWPENPGQSSPIRLKKNLTS